MAAEHAFRGVFHTVRENRVCAADLRVRGLPGCGHPGVRNVRGFAGLDAPSSPAGPSTPASRPAQGSLPTAWKSGIAAGYEQTAGRTPGLLAQERAARGPRFRGLDCPFALKPELGRQ